MKEREYLDYLSLPTRLYNQIESDVADLFSKLNITSYPIDPVEVALSLGYELIPFSKMSKEAKRMLFFKDVDAISHYDPEKKTFVIYYRPDGLKERFRFTIGHEIGHIRMGHKGESELARRIADYYSAYLLAPSPWIGQAGCEDFKEVATTFYLSEPCASRCFDRYQHWCKIRYTKDYEKTLLRLIA